MMINSFIDMEDSIYAYKPDNLQTKRTEVEVNDEVPAYTYVRSSYSRGKSTKKSRKSSKYSKSSRNAKGGKSITIREGDTLSEIAARNHTTVKKLRKLNGISGSNIRAGKKIKVK